MNVQVSYFSGTGCTEYVAQAFSAEFRKRGHGVKCADMAKAPAVDDTTDLLVVCFVVHACNAPEPVMNWVKRLRKTDGKRVVVISVSGGGEVSPNLACRVPVIHALRKKGYRLAYEKMLVMPSNWIVETKPVLCSKLIQVLPGKVAYVVNDVLNGIAHFNYPLLGNRLFTALGKFERIGAHSFGKGIRVDSRCNRCGLCVTGCPVSNIALSGDKPAFGKKCVLCLNCIYSCPQKALRPTIMKFVVIPAGFSLKDMLALPGREEEIDLHKETKGFAWIGVRRYLLNKSDML